MKNEEKILGAVLLGVAALIILKGTVAVKTSWGNRDILALPLHMELPFQQKDGTWVR